MKNFKEAFDFVQELRQKTPEELKSYVDSRFGLLEDLLVFMKEKSEFLKNQNESLKSKIDNLEDQISALEDRLSFRTYEK